MPKGSYVARATSFILVIYSLCNGPLIFFSVASGGEASSTEPCPHNNAVQTAVFVYQHRTYDLRDTRPRPIQ